jgi:rare lipoprotein A
MRTMRRMTRTTSTAIALVLAVACGNRGERSDDTPLATAQGQASFYSDRFEGRRTASGVTFSQDELVAAHRRYPFGTLLRVTNRNNDRSVRVTVVDRGPYAAPSTIIDLSRSAALQIGLDAEQGRVPVTVEVLEWGEGRGAS